MHEPQPTSGIDRTFRMPPHVFPAHFALFSPAPSEKVTKHKKYRDAFPPPIPSSIAFRQPATGHQPPATLTAPTSPK
jgi:hypothetical protein